MWFLDYDLLFIMENLENKWKWTEPNNEGYRGTLPQTRPPRARPPLLTHPPPTTPIGNRPQMLSGFLCTHSHDRGSQVKVISSRPRHC